MCVVVREDFGRLKDRQRHRIAEPKVEDAALLRPSTSAGQRSADGFVTPILDPQKPTFAVLHLSKEIFGHFRLLRALDMCKVVPASQ
jgi:hypothetical protein